MLRMRTCSQVLSLVVEVVGVLIECPYLSPSALRVSSVMFPLQKYVKSAILFCAFESFSLSHIHTLRMDKHFPVLKERVYTSKRSFKTLVSLQEDSSFQHRPLQYKRWIPNCMTHAYQSVLRDGLSIRRAAEEFNVPRTTLADRVSGKVQDGRRSGRARYLTDSEESELVKFLINCA